MTAPTRAHDGPGDALARYRITSAEAAAALNVSRQLMNYWAREGRDTPDGDRAYPGGVQLGDRRWYSPENLERFARELMLIAPDWSRLHLTTQRALHLGWFDANGRNGLPDQRISEAEAAALLGLSKVALRMHRLRGTLPPEVARTLLPGTSGHGGVTYSAHAVLDAAEQAARQEGDE